MVLVGLGAFVAGLTGVITEGQVTAIIVTSVIANKAIKKIELLSNAY